MRCYQYLWFASIVLPSMMYVSEIWYINDNNLRSLDRPIAWNNAFRKFLMGSGERMLSHCCFTVNVYPLAYILG